MNKLIFPKIYVAEGYDSIADKDGNMGFGVYDPDDKKIYVAEDVPYELFVKTLFHELVHWVQDATGNEFNEDEANNFAEKVYDSLPSAQPDADAIHLQREQAYMQGWEDGRASIIRCKDCKYSHDVYGDGDCYCKRPGRMMDWFGQRWDYYCADAERRTDETD